MLKRYIAEIGSIREGKGVAPPEKVGNSHSMKIAAPKPVRARPLAFALNNNSKWIQASPIKSETSDLGNQGDD
jgi:hypothetical protein